MLKKFVSIFLSKFPDRFACLVIIICIVVLGSFAYETVGLPVQAASATGDGAAATAVGWVYAQNCFGDRIRPDTVSATAAPADGGAYRVAVDFVSLEYRVDLGSGELHHIPVGHSVDILVTQGRVVSAAEGLRDLLNGRMSGPVLGVSQEYF